MSLEDEIKADPETLRKALMDRAGISNDLLASPFQKTSWDIMGALPATTRGHKYILVVADLFSKWIWLKRIVLPWLRSW